MRALSGGGRTSRRARVRAGLTLAGGRSLGARLGWRTGVAIFVAALAVRILYVVVFLGGYHMMSDAHHYHDIAGSIVNGRGFAAKYPYGFEHPTAFRPPLYPLLLAGAYEVGGNRIGSAQGLNVLLGSAVVVMVALLATRLGGRRAGLIAAVLAGVYPPLLANDGVPLSEPTGLLVMLLAIWAFLAGRPGWAGVCCGLLVLTRPSAQLLVPLMTLVLWWKVGFRRALGFAVVAVLVVSPWVIRNESVYHQPVIVTSNGFNLAAIYSPLALQVGHFVDPVFDPRSAPIHGLAHNYANYNEATLDDAFRAEGLQGIRVHPGKVAVRMFQNALRLVDLTWRQNDGPEVLDGRPLTLRHASLPMVWLVEAVGLVGLVQLARRRRYGPRSDGSGRLGPQVIPLIAGYFFVVSFLTVSVPRLLAPVDVLLIVAIGVLASRYFPGAGREAARDPAAEPSADPQGPVGILDDGGDVQPARVIAGPVLPEPVGRVREVERAVRRDDRRGAAGSLADAATSKERDRTAARPAARPEWSLADRVARRVVAVALRIQPG